MPETTYAGYTVSEILTALGYLLGFIVLALLFRIFLVRIVHKLIGKTATTLDNLLVDNLKHPIFVGLILAGMYLAAASLPLTGDPEKGVVEAGHVVLAAVGIYICVAFIDAVFKWYCLEVAPKTVTGLDDQMVPILRKIVPIVAGFLGLILILDLVEVNVSPVKSWLTQHGGIIALITVVSLVVVFTVSQIGPRLINAAVAHRMKDEPELEIKKRAETLAKVLVTTIQVVILTVAFFMVLAEMGLNITPILTGVGVIGIAIGFGAQSLVKDIISGLFIIVENQYRVGDVVRVADTSGLVQSINLRRTMLRDLDGIVHVIPNGEIKVASNFTGEWSRANLNISVAYGEDLDRVIEVINRVGNELAQDPQWAPRILTPPQALRVDNLGDSGIDIKVLGDTKPIEQWAVMGELRKRLKKAFDEEGIEIPWPHTKVYFGNAPVSSDKTDMQKN